MKLSHIAEPELEFGNGTHIDPRRGIVDHGVYDLRIQSRRDRILVGGIGTSEGLSRLGEWIESVKLPIATPNGASQWNLRVPFCGFNRSIGFKADLFIEDRNTKAIPASELREIADISEWNRRVDAAVDAYYRQARFLTQNRVVDVVVCVIPSDLYSKVARDERKPLEETLESAPPANLVESNFRRALKARAMHLGRPLQLIIDSTFDAEGSGLQDPATKAWNLCTALYYKANQTVPWRLINNPNRPAVCFVGIGFYRSRDRKVINTSLAQVFDELGHGVILRGSPVTVDRDDRQPHLTEEQAYDLLRRALAEYELALDTTPGRLVLHKSSRYTTGERAGFRRAVKESRVRTVDMVTILDSDLRLFRGNPYPPHRGTHVELDRHTHLLYTRGSVEYFRTYPGLYIPQPLEIRIAEADEAPSVICAEILALTKMNWNNTQFDGKYPITLQCARRVGEIMKYLKENDGEPQINYSYYM